MNLGGVDTSIKAFTGGLDNEMLDDYSAKEIATIQATDVISGGRNRKFYDPSDTTNWVVDFEGVVKGFL